MKTDLNGMIKLHQGQGPFSRSALAYLFFLPGAVPVKAQQINGTPGSPEATQKSNLKAGLALGVVVMLMTLPAFGAPNPDRDAYFGETHIHTSWSVDAWVMGNRLTGPDEAYKYAQGQVIKHPLGYDIKIDTPLDFMGVTDHAEYVAITKEAYTPGSYVSQLPEAQPLIMKDPNDPAEQQRVFSYLLKLAGSAPVKAFMKPKVTTTVWAEACKIADENNHPGKFTAFRSYEWTSMPGQRNLHRNIFFRGDKVPDAPFSALDSQDPTELWKWMDTQRKAGNELLAIAQRQRERRLDVPPTRTRSARRNSRRSGRIRSSTLVSTPSTTPAFWRFPRRGGPSFRP